MSATEKMDGEEKDLDILDNAPLSRGVNTPSVEVSTFAPPSLLKRALSSRRFLSVAGLLGLATTFVGVATHVNAQSDVSKDTLEAFSSARPSIQVRLEDSMPSQKPIGEIVESTKSLTETLGLILMDNREDLEKNPKEITAMADVLASNGDVAKTFYVVNNNLLLETHFDLNGIATEHKLLSQAPAFIQSMIADPDGQSGFLGGKLFATSNQAKIYHFSNGGRTLTEVTSSFPPDVEGITQWVRLDNNLYLANNSRFEAGSNQMIVAVNPDGSVSVRTVTFRDQNGNLSPLGNARGISGVSTKSATQSVGNINLIAEGSSQLQTGLLFMDIDPLTAQGVVEHLTQVKIGDQIINLGYLYGKGFYTENGHRHVVSSNMDRQLLYDTDLDSNDGSYKTATQLYYGDLLDSKGFVSYLNGRFGVLGVLIRTDSQGNRKTLLSGSRGIIAPDGMSRAAVLELETGVAWDLAPTNPSGTGEMQQRKLKGGLVDSLVVEGLGLVLIDQNSKMYYPDKNLPGKLTARDYLPGLYKGYSGNW